MSLQKRKENLLLENIDNIKKDLFDKNKVVKLIKLCHQQKNLTPLWINN